MAFEPKAARWPSPPASERTQWPAPVASDFHLGANNPHSPNNRHPSFTSRHQPSPTIIHLTPAPSLTQKPSLTSRQHPSFTQSHHLSGNPKFEGHIRMPLRYLWGTSVWPLSPNRPVGHLRLPQNAPSGRLPWPPIFTLAQITIIHPKTTTNHTP